MSMHDYTDILFVGMELPFFTLQNYILCYFATTLTLNVESADGIIYGVPWYEMSRREQVFVQLIIQRSQKVFEIKGLSIFSCSLASFQKVSCARGPI